MRDDPRARRLPPGTSGSGALSARAPPIAPCLSLVVGPQARFRRGARHPDPGAREVRARGGSGARAPVAHRGLDPSGGAGGATGGRARPRTRGARRQPGC